RRLGVRGLWDEFRVAAAGRGALGFLGGHSRHDRPGRGGPLPRLVARVVLSVRAIGFIGTGWFVLPHTWWLLSSFWSERFMKILIADDGAVWRRLLQSYLQKWEYEVAAAKDGAEAWDLFERGGFPIVITDWMMPELDGPGLIRRIRSSQRPGYIYAILLTA